MGASELAKDAQETFPTLIKGLDYSCEEKAQAALQGQLLEVSLSLSRLCNMRCRYCFTNGGAPRENELTTEARKNILTEAAAIGAKTWYLAGDGEPMLDKDLLPLIDHANEKGLYVVMFTDGVLMDEELAQQFRDRGISIIVKWNSMDRKVFEDVTQHSNIEMVERDGMNVPKALHLLLEEGLAEQIPTRLGIETTILRQNQHEIAAMYEFCKRNNVYPHIERLFRGGRAKDNPDLFPENMEIIPPHLAADICSNRIHYMRYIRSDGEMFGCFNSDGEDPKFYIGNVRDKSLAELVELGNQQIGEMQARYPDSDCMCSTLGMLQKKEAQKGGKLTLPVLNEWDIRSEQ